jgi:hypothetical protein
MADQKNISTDQSMPVAAVRTAPRWNWIWVVPAMALIFAGVLGYTYVIKRGRVITIRYLDGHGIKAEDALRCKGIIVGQVESVMLNAKKDGVVVRARLNESASDIARSGSSFWIVRPHVSITEVSGLETITGPRYIAVEPGEGETQLEFVGLSESPVVALVEPDGLEVTLYAKQRGSVTRGAPILYRQIQIGTVLSMGLSSDAASVEVQAYIRPMYKDLIREDTKFWNVSGADMKLGWSGLKFELESMQTLLDGGIALSTPNSPGKPVRNGHRFSLLPAPEDEWLNWRPALVVGSSELPAGAVAPTLIRATARRTGGRLWQSTTQIKGWVLQLSGGLLGPADMLAPVNKKKHETKAELELGGRRMTLSDKPIWVHGGLMLVRAKKLPVTPWPYDRIRQADKAEDCLIFTDGTTPPMPVDSSRIRVGQQNLVIDGGMSFDRNLHGAAVVARKDGMLIGVLMVTKGRGTILPVKLPTSDTVKAK